MNSAHALGPANAVPAVDLASLDPRGQRGGAGKRTRTGAGEGEGGERGAGDGAAASAGAAAKKARRASGDGVAGMGDWAMSNELLAAMGLDDAMGGAGDGAGGGEAAAQALPGDVRAKMEASFGADFSSVRIHQGGKAAAQGARAFAQGDDVHFAPGQYQPHSAGGQEVLGHELAHVVQQRQGKVSAPQHQGGAVSEDAGLEREADEMGARAARGERAGGASSSGAIPDRAPSGRAPRQLLKFRDVNNVEYDPEEYPQWELEQILAALELQAPTDSSHPAYVTYQNRIGMLSGFIGSIRNGGHPTKAWFGANFESKHVIRDEALNDQTIKAAIDASIRWDRDRNTSLHVSSGEVELIARAAMQKVAEHGYPQDVMVPFSVVVGWVSQYKEGALIPGVAGDFNLYRDCRVELGVIYRSGSDTADIMHLEKQVEWPPAASYQYLGRSVVKLWGSGPESYNV